MPPKKSTGTHLFIDTNILLGFYAYTKDDLEQLEKLLTLIGAKAIKLYFTRQVVDEFVRNRELKLDESLKQFDKTVVQGCPSFMRTLDEYEGYQKALAVYQKAHSALLDQAKQKAWSRILPADELFSKLVKSSNVIEISEQHFEAAMIRHQLGNPPGKAESLGDQLNWEVLLAAVPEGADLHVISQDGDFSAKLNPAFPKDFLCDEWSSKRGGTLYVYQQLGQFFKENYPSERFALQIEKQTAIQKLINSGSFAATHAAVSLLDPNISFLTSEEAEQVVHGALSNSQVAWIVSDADVESFLMKMLKEHGESLKPALRARLMEALNVVDASPIDPGEPIDVEDFDIPFSA